ncbi:MAG: D-aminoacyl-tRNA deacylase [Candidatus Howiella sp.]|jgi:D-tyrosyl-tRNA(Tyr) deacylase
MIAIVQRVLSAAVTADGFPAGEIGPGLLILLGVVSGDGEAEAAVLAAKTAALRIFCDEAEKMNRSLLDTAGGALVVSNFTLAANVRKGNRPSFTNAAAPEEAERLYEVYMAELRRLGVARVESGRFGADMQIAMTADGPVTITLDTDIWKRT